MPKDYRPFFHEKASKHNTVLSPETVDIKKFANLTTNTKNYGQMTPNPIQTLLFC